MIAMHPGSLPKPSPYTAAGAYRPVGLRTQTDWTAQVRQLTTTCEGDAQSAPALDPQRAQHIATLLEHGDPTQAGIKNLVALCGLLLPVLRQCDARVARTILDSLAKGVRASTEVWNLATKDAAGICIACARLGPAASELFDLFAPRVQHALGLHLLVHVDDELLSGGYGPRLFELIQRCAQDKSAALRPLPCCELTRVLRHQPRLADAAVGQLLAALRLGLTVDREQRILRRSNGEMSDAQYGHYIRCLISRLAWNLRPYWHLAETRALLEAFASTAASGFMAAPHIPSFQCLEDVDRFAYDVITAGNSQELDLHFCTYPHASHLVNWRLMQGTASAPMTMVTGNSDTMKALVCQAVEHVSPGWQATVGPVSVRLTVDPRAKATQTSGLKRGADQEMDRVREAELREQLLQKLARRRTDPVGPPSAANSVAASNTDAERQAPRPDPDAVVTELEDGANPPHTPPGSLSGRSTQL